MTDDAPARMSGYLARLAERTELGASVRSRTQSPAPAPDEQPAAGNPQGAQEHPEQEQVVFVDQPFVARPARVRRAPAEMPTPGIVEELRTNGGIAADTPSAQSDTTRLPQADSQAVPANPGLTPTPDASPQIFAPIAAAEDRPAPRTEPPEAVDRHDPTTTPSPTDPVSVPQFLTQAPSAASHPSFIREPGQTQTRVEEKVVERPPVFYAVPADNPVENAERPGSVFAHDRHPALTESEAVASSGAAADTTTRIDIGQIYLEVQVPAVAPSVQATPAPAPRARPTRAPQAGRPLNLQRHYLRGL